MPRLSLFTLALPVMVFASWWLHTISRAGSGVGFDWFQLRTNAKGTVAILAVLVGVAAFVMVAVLYFMRVRGHPVTAASVWVPPLIRLGAVFVVGTVTGIAFAEVFCLADERAFRRETAAFHAHTSVDPATGERPLHSRPRWWPGNGQLLVSPDSAPKR